MLLAHEKKKFAPNAPIGADPLGLRSLGHEVVSYLSVPKSFQMPRREIGDNGQPRKGWCAFHFAWQALHYFVPGEWNEESRPPSSAANDELLGFRIPRRLDRLASLLRFPGLRVGALPSYLLRRNMVLEIDGRACSGYVDLRRAMLRRGRFREAPVAIDQVILSLEQDEPVGIDINLAPLGFRDHVLFVYATSHTSLFVIDSLVVPGLGYRPVEGFAGGGHLMELPFEEFEKRWTSHGRIWTVRGLPPPRAASRATKR